MANENIVQFPGTQRVINQHGNGGGNGGDSVGERIARVESDVKHIDSNLVRMWDDIKDLCKDIDKVPGKIDDNFKWMIGGFITMAITTVSALAWFFNAFKDILLSLLN